MNYHELKTLIEKPLFSSLYCPCVVFLKITFIGSLKKKGMKAIKLVESCFAGADVDQ